MLRRVNHIGLVNTAIMPKKIRTTKKSIIATMTGPSISTKNINANNATVKNIATTGKSVRVVKADRISTTAPIIEYQKLFQILDVHPHSIHEIGVKKFKIHPIGPKIISKGK